jgi:hypothetical protein
MIIACDSCGINCAEHGSEYAGLNLCPSCMDKQLLAEARVLSDMKWAADRARIARKGKSPAQLARVIS